jgi:hypothetical protein
MGKTIMVVDDEADIRETVKAVLEKEVSNILRRFKSKKICYITLNKSCGAMREIFGKVKLNPDRVDYVDGISYSIGSPKAVKGCKYVKTPYDLDPIAKEVKKAINAGASVVIFDSLSNLLAYGSSAPAGINLLKDFIGSFSKDLEENNGDAVFLCKKSDAQNLLIEETIPTFHKVVGKKK